MSGKPKAGVVVKVWKGRALWVLKLGFTVFLLVLAFRHVPLWSLAEAWNHLGLEWALGATLFYVPLCVLVEAARLWTAGRHVQAPSLGIREWAAAFLASRPWFYLLPASAGADAMIWYRLRRKGWSHGGCGYAVLAVRFWGLAFWALVAGLTLIIAPGTRAIPSGTPGWIQSPAFWLGGGSAALLACVLAPRWLARKEHVELGSAGPMDPLFNFALAGLSAFISAACVWMAARAAGLPFDLPACLGLLAWLNFAMALPISLGGFGLQEALILRLGLPSGLPAAALLAFSGIVHLMRAALALTGGLAALRDEAPLASDSIP